MAECEARRLASQEYHCRRCALRWDADDPEPPTCPRELTAAGAPPAIGAFNASAIMGLQRASLTTRLSDLCERMRSATVLPSLCDELEDMVVEVGVIEQAHRAAKAQTVAGPLPANVVPITGR